MLIGRTIRLFGALLLVSSIGHAAFAQGANRWVYLGQASVNGLADHDRIAVGRDEGRFQKIQIRVAGAPVEFQRVVVHYVNGASEAIELRDRIPAGGQTRAVDLRGGDRAIRFVDFWYRKANWLRSAQPRVSLFGADFDGRNDHPNSPRPGSWVFLGQAAVNGRVDHDRILVGRDEGRFQNIQIRVVGAPIEFQRVVVHYANGSTEEVALRDRIPAGGQTRAIDLRGTDRGISSVEFWYSRSNWR
ncbi:MAG TPA: hypothetical protein VJS64_20275, partial [Pyrinomonadaceae bacterium]|nr:hypothetical protein [Pyrinomonadaceae bacterium]